ncbi:hypothetical protein Tco_0083346, partial [Tanacetum coccineum]
FSKNPNSVDAITSQKDGRIAEADA